MQSSAPEPFGVIPKVLQSFYTSFPINSDSYSTILSTLNLSCAASSGFNTTKPNLIDVIYFELVQTGSTLVQP